MDYEQIAYEVADGVATVTLDRPDRLNAYTPQMLAELLDAMDRVDGDDEVRAVVFTGRGRAFCAGADLGRGGTTFTKEGEAFSLDQHADGGGRLTQRLYRSTKPLIAAVNGPAVGVGVTMTLPMDVRLAAEGARFGFVFARRGIVPEACSSWFLPRVVGISQAMEWVATGRVFDAEEALRGGLVRSVHPPGELLEAARALGREIAEHTSPVSVAMARTMLWRMLEERTPAAAHEIDSRAMFARGRSDDAREGVSAFVEKRPAAFPLRVSADLPEDFARWRESASVEAFLSAGG
ncbi:MAG TPA: crotonase/enoyl-CoA hydratase family protein [Solirubrobacteraceae bacterium]